jgi:tRNA-modifying protein YgfZ
MNRIPIAVKNAAEHAVAIVEHGRRIYSLSGHDGLDLLNRLCTNDLFEGPSARAVFTSFCNEKGKLIEAMEVVSDAQETLLICSATGSGKLISWIAKFTIAEDIQITDVSSEFTVASLVGPHAISYAERIGLISAERQAAETRKTGKGRVTAWESMFGTLPSVRLLSRDDAWPMVVEQFRVARLPVDETRSVYEFLRVLHGVPEYGHEVAETFTPYEAGLTATISYAKGCYVGQEVLTRIDTYRKTRRGLRLLWSDAPEVPKRGEAVVVSGETVGVVTSAVSALGRVIVLAVTEKGITTPHEVIRITNYPYVLNPSPIPPFSIISSPETA